jgi:hypothetical protein
MFDVFENLGSFEAHVVDSSSQDISVTVAAIQEGLHDGRYLLDPSYEAIDMDRLALTFGVRSGGRIARREVEPGQGIYLSHGPNDAGAADLDFHGHLGDAMRAPLCRAGAQ